MIENNRLAIITWHDSAEYPNWYFLEEIQQFHLHNNMKAVGYIVREDDEAVVIASLKGAYNYGNCTIIPRSTITNISSLKEIDENG